MLLIKFKFGMCFMDHLSSHYINFGVYRRYSFFTGYTKCHTLLLIVSKYLKFILELLSGVPRDFFSIERYLLRNVNGYLTQKEQYFCLYFKSFKWLAFCLILCAFQILYLTSAVRNIALSVLENINNNENWPLL